MASSLSKGEKHSWLHFKNDRKDAPKDKDKGKDAPKDKDKDKEHSFLGSLMARRSSKKTK